MSPDVCVQDRFGVYTGRHRAAHMTVLFEIYWCMFQCQLLKVQENYSYQFGQKIFGKCGIASTFNNWIFSSCTAVYML